MIRAFHDPGLRYPVSRTGAWESPVELVIARGGTDTKRVYLYNDSNRTVQLQFETPHMEKFVLTAPEKVIAWPGVTEIDISITGSSGSLPWVEDIALRFSTEDFETGSGFTDNNEYTEWAHIYDPMAARGPAGSDFLRFEISAFILPVADERYDPDKPTHLASRHTLQRYVTSGMGTWAADTTDQELDLITDLLYESTVWAVNKHYANNPLYGPLRFADSRAKALGYEPPGINQFPPSVRRRVLAASFRSVRTMSTEEGLRSAFAALGVEPGNMTVEHDSLNFTWKIRLPFYALGIFNLEYLGQYALYHVDAYNVVDIGIIETAESFIYTEIDYMVPPVLGPLPPTEGLIENAFLKGLVGNIQGENIGSPVALAVEITAPAQDAIIIDVATLSVEIHTPTDGQVITDASQDLITYDHYAVDTTSIIANPEVGWHGTVDNPADFSAVVAAGFTTTRWLVRLDAYRNTPTLPISFLNTFRGVLQAAEDNGIKLLLRHVYNYQELPRLDAPLNIMLGHIEQLGVIWHEYEHVIAAVQMGFIGEWGELHSSSNGIDSNISQRNQVFAAVLNNVPSSIMVNVRYPDMVQEYLGHNNPLPASERFTETHAARLGILNDSFLANYTDGGTYIESRYPPDYRTNEPIKSYWASYSPYVNTSGETVDLPWTEGNREFGPQAMAEMALFNWDSLNRDYSERVIAGWISGGYYDTITRHLGYRLAIRSVTTRVAADPGELLPFHITMQNDGWGKVFNRRPIHLILSSGGTEYVIPLSNDARRALPLGGSSTTMEFTPRIPDDIDPGLYQVYLALPDPSDEIADDPRYAIRLANQGLWENGVHNLGFSVAIGEAGLLVEILTPADNAVILEDDQFGLEITYPADGQTLIEWELAVEITFPADEEVIEEIFFVIITRPTDNEIIVEPPLPSFDLLIFG